MNYNPDAAPIILPFFFLASFILIGVGIWQRVKTRQFLKTARETTGEIIESQSRTTMGYSGKRTQYARVHFVTETGEEIVYESMVGTLWEGKKIGKQVSILYNPEHPQHARIRSFAELTLPWGIPLLTGILMFCSGLIGLGYILLH